MIPIQDRLRGVVGMLAGRPGWRTGFDVTPSGLRESFLVLIPAAPLFLLSVGGQNLVSIELAPPGATPRPVGLIHGAILFTLYWAYFPLVARVFTRAFGVGEAFAPWVVVHNWTQLVLLVIQALIGALLLGGLLPPAAYQEVGPVYFLFAIYAHCRVAIGALEAPWPLAIGAACVPVLIWLIVQILLAYTFDGAALQA